MYAKASIECLHINSRVSVNVPCESIERSQKLWYLLDQKGNNVF